MTAPGDVAERDHPGRGGDGVLHQSRHLCLALEGARDEDGVDLHAVVRGPVVPGTPAGRVFLAGYQDLVAGFQANADRAHVQRLAGVAGQHHLIRVRPEQGRESGNHPAGDDLAQVVFPVQRLLRQGLVAGAHSLRDGRRRHPQARVVHVCGARFQDEAGTYMGPGVVFDSRGRGNGRLPARRAAGFGFGVAPGQRCTRKPRRADRQEAPAGDVRTRAPFSPQVL